MEWKKYERLAIVTSNKDLTKEQQLANAVMGLNGEIGEVTDIIKKHLYQGHKLDTEHIQEELGDILWYLALLTNELNIDLDQIKQDNIDKLRARFPEGFKTEDSINRRV